MSMEQRLDEDVVQRAIFAIFKYVQKKSSEQLKLFDDDGEKIQVCVSSLAYDSCSLFFGDHGNAAISIN